MNSSKRHIPEPELIQLARTGGAHPHCAECAFCSEQLTQLRSMLGQEQFPLPGQRPPPDRFRLAAQGGAEEIEELIWRQTWYFEEGQIVLRVVEDPEEDVLLGYVLCDPERLSTIRVRFSGLETSFLPDPAGRFVIGPPSIDIEPMTVQLQ